MKKKFLHVGCGPDDKTNLRGFNTGDWQEIRFDIDEGVRPDIVGSMADMSQVADESVDAIYSAHNIEHLYMHQVVGALREFRRVLRPDGFVVLTCPDLQTACEAVAAGRLIEPLYRSASGPISAIDMIYGYRGALIAGNDYMAHKCGFTYPVLRSCFIEAGFVNTLGGRRLKGYDLWIAAFKSHLPEAVAREIGSTYLPLPSGKV